MSEFGPEWNKIAEGTTFEHYLRESTLPSGMRRTETIWPNRQEIIHVIDAFPDAQKSWNRYDVEPAKKALLKELVEMMQVSDPSLHLPYVAFFNETEGVQQTARIFLHDDFRPDEYIKVLFTEQGSLTGDIPSVENLALVELTYRPGKSVQCVVRGEEATSLFVPAEPGSKYLHWQQRFPTILNYLKDEDEESLKSWHGVMEEDYEEYKNHPLKGEAETITNELTEQVISSVPYEDRAEALRLLTAFGWQFVVARSLLRAQARRNTTSVREALEQFESERGEGTFLDWEVEGVEDNLTGAKAKSYQNTLEIDTFLDTIFSWKTVEVEKDLADELLGLEGKRIEKEEKESVYGETVFVQQYGFRVDREGDRIRITRMTNGNKPLWVSEFDLTIPFEDIADIYRDGNADFRRIKSMLTTSFKKEN